MQAEIQSLQEEILAAIAAAADADALEAVRIKYLGRPGRAAVAAGKKMATVPREERPAVGKAANQAKGAVAAAFEARKAELTAAAETADFDPTLPGRYEAPGSIHPVPAGARPRDRDFPAARFRGGRRARHRERGLQLRRAEHAARPSRPQRAGHVLSQGGRPRAQPGPRRSNAWRPAPDADGRRPPCKSVPCWSRTARRSGSSRRAAAIAGTRSMRRTACRSSRWKGSSSGRGSRWLISRARLEYFFRELLGGDLKFRFRPHFFPFTEPSFEVDCAREGSQVKGREWRGNLRLRHGRSRGLPAGRRYDADKYTGYAFGFGIERIAIMRHGIPDPCASSPRTTCASCASSATRLDG